MNLQIKDFVTFSSILVSKITDLVTTYIPKILFALVIYIIGKLVIKWICNSVRKILIIKNLEPSLQSFLNSLVRILLHLFLLITVFGMLGINLTSFAAILAGLAVGVGAALNGTLGNFAGGVMMLIFKPFKLGDFIEAQGHSGTVKELGIFNTFLLSKENKIIILANGALSTGTIVNHTTHGNIIIEMFIAIPYEINLGDAKKILTECLLTNPSIIKSPKPEVYISKVEDKSMVLSIKVYCLQEDSSDIYYQSQEMIKEVLDKNGIDITSRSAR